MTAIQQQETNAPTHKHPWTIPQTDRILTHKTNPQKFKGTELIQSTFSDHIGIIQENIRKTRQSSSTWKWNNTRLNSLGSEGQGSNTEVNENENNIWKYVGCS